MMMCEPSEADLALCVERGIAAARQAGESTPEVIWTWARREVLAAWPHIEASGADAAISRYLVD
ncbi:MAG: hypothetical protein V1262_00950 [Alphaproteobacteria bacterium]|nr:hypothetical protein [Alphaproteobacteria bacterium]